MKNNKEISGDKEKKEKQGKTEKRKYVRILLSIVLTAATVTASLSGINYLGGKSVMNRLTRESNVSESGKMEESLEFQKLTDSYLQALELYLEIRRMGSGDGSFYKGKIEDMPFLQTGAGTGEKTVTLKEVAGWKGHNYDYDGYFNNYINSFEEYSQDQVSIRKKASQLFTLKNVYFATGDWQNSTLYDTVASGQKYSAKEWKKAAKQERDTPTTKRYEGQETLLPGLQGDSQRAETAVVDMIKTTQKIPLHSIYAKWLEQAYSGGYAKGWLMYQMALAAENDFEGSAEDGTKYNDYYDYVMKDYRKAHCITQMDNIECNSKTVENTGIVYIYDALDDQDSKKALRLNEDDKLYYNDGKSEFTLKNFLSDPNAYYNDVTDDLDYYVYDTSLEKYTQELKKKGQALMENAISTPWKLGQTLCSESMAADLAQFMLSFGNGLEKFLQKSDFLYDITVGGKSLVSSNEKWTAFVDNLERGAIDQKQTSYDYEYAIYDARGEVYQSNWFWDGFNNSGDLKDFLKKMTGSSQNAYVVVGYPALDVTSADKTSGMASLYQDYLNARQQYMQAKNTATRSIVIFGVSLLCLLIVFFGLAVTSGKAKSKAKRIQKIPSELLVVIALGGVCLLNDVVYDLYHISDWEQTMERIIIGNISITRLTDALLIAALALAVMIILLGLIQRICQNRVTEHSLLQWCYRKGKTGGKLAGAKLKVFVQKYRDTKAFVRYGIAVIVFAVLWLLIWIVCWINVVVNYPYGASFGITVVICVIGLPLLLIAGEGALLLAMRNAIADEKIRDGAVKIAQGEISYQIELPDKASKEQKELADTINHIRQGLESAVEESIRSERMKTELITNVSHDIKTPLTSVINYVDLLKREHFENERVQEYLDILDRKSMRLKGLIEDLVEASKASSGTIELQITTLNYGELVNQTNGEFEEKFARSGLTLVADISDEAVRFRGDGRRVFRILENLYGNVAKYALEGTRVYVSLSEKTDSITGQKMAEFSIKNISREQLNINPDELTERFVRGDSSRTTEGSGLGLYIANNLTELMGGKFEIRLDGDLFHVTVSFPVEE